MSAADYLWLARGNTILNSVKTPGSIATSIVPPCCFTIMSWLIDRPSPVSALSFQLNAYAFSAIQQPPEVKAGECIAGMRSDQRRKRGHRRDVSGLELGEGLGILRRRRPPKCRLRQRLVSAQRLAAPAQQEIADRPAAKLLCAVSDRGADANARTEKLVGGLKPRRGVDGVAIRRIVEEATAAEIADQRRAGMNADAGDTEIHPLGLPSFAKFLGPDIQMMSAGDRPGRIVRLVARRVEQDLDRVADDLCDSALMREDDIG